MDLTPYPPNAIVPHPTLLVLRDEYGRRWRVDDLRRGERPLVRRRPPDPEATHRLFTSHDGVRCWLPLDGPCATSIRGQAPDMLAAWPLYQQLHCAVGQTRGTRARLRALGEPWLTHDSRARWY